MDEFYLHKKIRGDPGISEPTVIKNLVSFFN